MPFLDDSAIISSNSNIITSQVMPTSPTIGDAWNELDSENNLIQKWNYLSRNNNNAWMGEVQDFPFPDVSMSQSQIYQLNWRFNYFIKSFYGSYYSNSAMPSNGILTRRLMFGNRSNLVSSNLIATIAFAGKSATINDTIRTTVNTLVTTAEINNEITPTKINLLGNYPASSGSFTVSINSYFVTSGFSYQLVRK
ncbi:hypothetical protein [Brunnivagina elsteri]|uniref:Uncharacterized protein n=1 Tax=Brunnivagina elsteri CCALA 953 TaxID=987040 RepID=A0A2A2TLS4_9CYAN|nr:hypothetical protein [Calothrix elsteri]PAX58359.1 hypothetical protein CK510_07770 [Calothrix elsteri CCALA 953]